MDALRQWSVSAPWEFRDTECTVSADVTDDVLVVQVEEKLSAEQWKGQFTAKHIEELTSKTGNFKQFAVFLNMLESAIAKSSDSVSLDLLTYSDLEAMRNRKLGAEGPSPAKHGRQLHGKRYLILTYTVEFDRIHYPLALPYAGKPDPALLQETIRKLQTELERYKKQVLQGQKHTAMTRLQRDYDALLQEKEDLEEAFEAFRQEVTLTRQGNASKELRILKKVIKNLEKKMEPLFLPAYEKKLGQLDIEELTSKTGNFKQFAVFLNMLESAITKSSDSVSLDLLTYSDLEAMRNRKLGAEGPSPAKHGRQLHGKRYLILTYTVEFDRIHYPLALPYAGKPDPALLQETIRKLQTELERYKKQVLQGQKHTAMTRLQRDYDALLQEKEDLEEAFEAFRQEVTLTRQGNASKELRILKKVIKNLEADILKERTRHQRHANKKNEEVRALLQELDELRSSERSLRIRAKSLTNELAVLRNGLRSSPSAFRSARSSGSGTKKLAALRRRSSSNERPQPPAASKTARFRIRTPSPSGARVPRFDPTAYIKSKERKQLDANVRLGRVKVAPRSSMRARSRSVSAERPHLPPRPSPGSGSQSRRLHTEGGRRRSRTSSVGSDGSRGSSRRSSADLSGSGSSVIVITSGHRGSGGKSSSRQKRKRPTRQPWESPTVQASTPTHSKRRTTQRTTSHNDSNLLDHSAEISEIDARLNALQHFMKRSLDATKAHSNK